MAIEVRTRDTLQYSGDICNGQTQVMLLNASVDPGTGVQVYAQALDKDFVETNRDEVAAAAGAFIVRVLGEAVKHGVPLLLPGGDGDG